MTPDQVKAIALQQNPQCEVTGQDCRPAGPCPGCCLARGGQWDGKQWVYPDGTRVYDHTRIGPGAL